MVVERCDSCPLDALDWARGHSEAGRLLDTVLQLDFNAEAFAVPIGRVTAEQVKGLQVLREERQRYSEEKHKSEQERRQDEARMEDLKRRSKGF